MPKPSNFQQLSRQPVTPDELQYAISVGSAAAAGKIPKSGVGGMGVDILDDETGETNRYELTDIPANRMAIAVRDQFSREKFPAVMMRSWALGPLLDDERMKPYIRQESDDGSFEMHEVVLEVAAVMPLNPEGEFNRNTFFKRVAKLYAERGDDE